MPGFGSVLLSNEVMITEEIRKLKKFKKPICYFFNLLILYVFCFLFCFVLLCFFSSLFSFFAF